MHEFYDQECAIPKTFRGESEEASAKSFFEKIEEGFLLKMKRL